MGWIRLSAVASAAGAFLLVFTSIATAQDRCVALRAQLAELGGAAGAAEYQRLSSDLAQARSNYQRQLTLAQQRPRP